CPPAFSDPSEQPQPLLQPCVTPNQVRQIRYATYAAAVARSRTTTDICQSIRSSLPCSSAPAAQLIHHQCAHVREYRHVQKLKNRPPPGPRLALDHDKRRGALATQRKEHHHGQGGWHREGGVTSERLAEFRLTGQPRGANFAGVDLALVENDAKRADHD